MADVSTYTAEAKSESVGIVKSFPPLKATASGSGTGSGTTQLAAIVAAGEAAKRASRTALDTVQNITHQVWENLTTGFKKEYPIDDIECYITFDTNYISYAALPGVTGTIPSEAPKGIFWQTVFSGEAYKVNIPPAIPHLESIGINFGNISAVISAAGSVRDEYNFNITVDTTIHSDITKKLVKDKTSTFTSKMTWIGTFTSITPITTSNIGSIVLDILNDDLPAGYIYDSSKTDITLNAPG